MPGRVDRIGDGSGSEAKHIADAVGNSCVDGGFDGHAANRRYAWYAVGVLMLVQVVSYLDRFLPSLLVADIKSDLALSDFQVGLLLGPAFGIFYVVAGLPLGWLADRKPS